MYPEGGRLRLFIAIGTAPKNGDLRQTLRDTWMQWVADRVDVQVRFFTEEAPDTASEAAAHGDLVFHEGIPSGYGHFMARFHYQVEWALARFDFDYFLKLDDDGFLCVPRLLADLDHVPDEKLFWGKYFCEQGFFVADENFMLFSGDVVTWFHSAWPMLRMQDDATFASHFAMWQHFMDLDVLDDRRRIDAQQGQRTTWMHTPAGEAIDATPEDYANFCVDQVWAHHVPSTQVLRNTFEHTSWTDHPPVGGIFNTPGPMGTVCFGDGTKKWADQTYLFVPALTSLGLDGGHEKSAFPAICSWPGYDFSHALRNPSPTETGLW